MLTKRFTRPFRRLRGKLTLSYTLTTVVTFLLVEIAVVGAGLLISSLNVSYFVLNVVKQEAPQAPPYFIHGSPDREALTTWLRIVNDDTPSKQGPFYFSHPIFLTVLDTQGRAIASIGTHPVPSDMLLETQLSPQNRADLHTVLHSVNGTVSTVDSEVDGTLVAMTPIVRKGGSVEGVLVMKIVSPDKLQLLVEFSQFIAVSVIILTVLATIASFVPGYLTARSITHRLNGLSVAADHWSRGDFSAYTDDVSEDELGQTTRQLNRMAEQLQHLLQARQKLATLEERNRLARDLHDSVKQQVFAVSMQIGAIKFLLRRNVDAAEVRLLETEKLVHQAQQELTSLIRELRPVALEGKGLVAALRELALQWTQQTDIVANVRVEDIQTLPLSVEEALYRVVQEALANVARHSKATLVQILVTTTDDGMVTLSVADNGQGFDATHHGHLGVGLLSIQERMKALGGDAQIESTPGKGTRIVAYCKRLGVDTCAATSALHDEA
ncbi:MAG: hypothetical protein NVS4B11_01700 [Ktedonobacteraceae bacterium]